MKFMTKITGIKIHEVGYRVFLLRKALELGVDRFNAYNTKENGKQVLIALLDAGEEQFSAFKKFAKANMPEGAQVSDVTFEDFEGYVVNIADYMHLLQVEQLSKGVPAILSIDRKQDSMLEKQDSMLEKLDETKKEIVGEIRELRWDLKSYLDEKLIRIESDIAQIKAKIGL